MNASITQTPGAEAYDLIYPGYLSMLPEVDQQSMHQALNSSIVWILRYNDEILCVYGIAATSLLADEAYMWLFTTEAMADHLFIFVRISRQVIANMLQHYPRLIGHCVVGNDKAIRWLKWLGAEFSKPQGSVVPYVIRIKSNG